MIKKPQVIKSFRTATITTEDGTQWATSINGTNSEIRKYFMGQYFNVGIYIAYVDPIEKMSKVTNLVII